MSKCINLAVCLAALFAVNASAEEESDETNNRTKLPPSIIELDTDGDGKASVEEFNAFRNGGSSESDDDVEDLDEDKRQISAFASFDKDKDGFVTQEELNSHAKYANPGNGSGELKALKNKDQATNQSSRSNSDSSRSESRNNKGNGKSNSNRGGGNNKKNGKDK